MAEANVVPADSFLSSNTARDARFTCGRRYPSHLPSSSAGAHIRPPLARRTRGSQTTSAGRAAAAGGPAGAAAGAAFAPGLRVPPLTFADIGVGMPVSGKWLTRKQKAANAVDAGVNAASTHRVVGRPWGRSWRENRDLYRGSRDVAGGV